MAWTVRIQTETGDSVGSDFDIAFDEIPCGSTYPICNSIARYYVTLLNPAQLETFITEWERAVRLPEFRHLAENRLIRDTAERCARDHLYLRFVGD
jgi:hypothetical protein